MSGMTGGGRQDSTIIWNLEAELKKFVDEVERLAASNAELIEALEAIVDHQYRVGGKLAVFSGTRAIAIAAIEKANLATNHPKD